MMNIINKLKTKKIISYEGNFLNDYYKTVKELVFNNTFMFVVIGVALLTYGFYMFFHGISADDLDMSRFFVEYGLIRQGRFVGQILHEVFGLMNQHMFFTMTITVGLFIIASIFTAALLKMISGIKSYFALALFTSLMLTFPTNALIFDFILAAVLTSLGYFLAILSAVHTIEFSINKKPKDIILTIIMMVLLISSYESFVFVYFMIILFVYLFSNTKTINLNVKSVVTFLALTCTIIIVSMVIESIIANGLINALGVEKSTRVSIMESGWFSSTNLLYDFNRLIYYIIVNYYLISLLDFSHMYHLILTLLLFLATFILSDKKNLWKNLLIVLIINITIFGISFIEAESQIPRTAQTIATFVMFGSGYVYLMLNKKILRNTFIVVMAFAIYSSAHLQNMYYEREWNNHVKQERFLNTIMYDIEHEYGTGQDVYFIGTYDAKEQWYDDSVLKFEKDTIAGNIFGWLNNRIYENVYDNPDEDYYKYSFYNSSVLIDVFGGYASPNLKQVYFVKYITYLGYDVNTCDIETLDRTEEKEIYENMANYPQEGYIEKIGSCIFVNISD